MKLLLLFIAFVSSLSADYLYTTKNICVTNVYATTKGYCYQSIGKNKITCNKNATSEQFIEGYELVDGTCTQKTNLKTTGLTENQWNFNMALLGHAIGFSQLFFTLFLTILWGRK